MYKIFYKFKNKKFYKDDYINLLKKINLTNNNLYNNNYLLYKELKLNNNINKINNNYLEKIIDDTNLINNNHNNLITNIFSSIFILYSIIVIYK